jgi:hypothetical protein
MNITWFDCCIFFSRITILPFITIISDHNFWACTSLTEMIFESGSVCSGISPDLSDVTLFLE